MDSAQLPETGSVLDNKDGSYAVSYRITKAGLYQHAITLAGTVGAGTPIFLSVSSDIADISRTYVYGSLLSLETGKASTVYIQVCVYVSNQGCLLQGVCLCSVCC